MWFNLVIDKKADSLLKWHFCWDILWNKKKSIDHPPAHLPLHRDWQTRCSSQSQSFPAHKGTQKLTNTVQLSVTIFSCTQKLTNTVQLSITIFSCTQRHTETHKHSAALNHNLFLHTKAHRNWWTRCSSQSQSFLTLSKQPFAVSFFPPCKLFTVWHCSFSHLTAIWYKAHTN